MRTAIVKIVKCFISAECAHNKNFKLDCNRFWKKSLKNLNEAQLKKKLTFVLNNYSEQSICEIVKKNENFSGLKVARELIIKRFKRNAVTLRAKKLCEELENIAGKLIFMSHTYKMLIK